LLRAGADFHIAYSWIVGEDSAIRGMTPLHMAAAQGNKEVVLLLLKAQAQGLGGRGAAGRDIRDQRDIYNMTPADKALQYKNTDLAELLQPDADIGGLLEGVQSLIEPTRTLREIAGLAHHEHLQKALEAAAALGSFDRATVQLGLVQKQHKDQNQCHKQQQQSRNKEGERGFMLCSSALIRSSSTVSAGADARVTVSVTSDTSDKFTQVTPGDEDTCPVCLECTATSASSSGVELLPCRHELCAACAKGIWQHVDARVTVMSCPICRSHVAGVKGTAR